MVSVMEGFHCIPLGCLSAPGLKFNVMFWVDSTVGLNACGGFGILGFGIAERDEATLSATCVCVCVCVLCVHGKGRDLQQQVNFSYHHRSL